MPGGTSSTALVVIVGPPSLDGTSTDGTNYGRAASCSLTESSRSTVPICRHRGSQRPVAPPGKIPALVFTGFVEVHSIDVADHSHPESSAHRLSDVEGLGRHCLQVNPVEVTLRSMIALCR